MPAGIIPAHALSKSGPGASAPRTGDQPAHAGGTILFYRTDKADGDQYAMIVGRNNTGLSIAFAKDSETTVDAEFKAKAMDGEGTLIIYGEANESLKTQ